MCYTRVRSLGVPCAGGLQGGLTASASCATIFLAGAALAPPDRQGDRR